MKTYTDEELQAAIDVAFSAKTGEAYLVRRPDVAPKSWPQESLLRLAIAKAFLEKLPKDSRNTELERIITAAHEAGWNGVENSKDLAQFIKDLAEEVGNRQAALIAAATSIDELTRKVGRWFNQSKAENEKYLKAVEEIGRLKGVQPDPYAELKKAHAEGKVIQHRFSGHLPWNDTDKPEFLNSREYRIKPDEPASNPVQDMALGGQMQWRGLARQLAEVWWKCHNIGASLQHGDIDTDVSFTVCCELHGGRCFHADTPNDAWRKAEKWLMSPDRENFPALDAVKEVAQ